jgi:hypothetical protein
MAPLPSDDATKIALDTLKSLRARVINWQQDPDCNLAPTVGSLASALTEIEVAIARLVDRGVDR